MCVSAGTAAAHSDRIGRAHPAGARGRRGTLGLARPCRARAPPPAAPRLRDRTDRRSPRTTRSRGARPPGPPASLRRAPGTTCQARARFRHASASLRVARREACPCCCGTGRHRTSPCETRPSPAAVGPLSSAQPQTSRRLGDRILLITPSCLSGCKQLEPSLEPPAENGLPSCAPDSSRSPFGKASRVTTCAAVAGYAARAPSSSR